jgi:hypothetical protein
LDHFIADAPKVADRMGWRDWKIEIVAQPIKQRRRQV